MLDACQGLRPAASGPALAACPWYAKLRRLKLLTIDHDPGTELRPVVGHDLELSRDGQQLARACVTYFYFKLFHISFLVVLGACSFKYFLTTISS